MSLWKYGIAQIKRWKIVGWTFNTIRQINKRLNHWANSSATIFHNTVERLLSYAKQTKKRGLLRTKFALSCKHVLFSAHKSGQKYPTFMNVAWGTPRNIAKNSVGVHNLEYKQINKQRAICTELTYEMLWSLLLQKGKNIKVWKTLKKGYFLRCLK